VIGFSQWNNYIYKVLLLRCDEWSVPINIFQVDLCTMAKWPTCHVSDPEVELIVLCSNPCILHLLKNCFNFTATNALTMGTKSGYIHYSAPGISEHISDAELH